MENWKQNYKQLVNKISKEHMDDKSNKHNNYNPEKTIEYIQILKLLKENCAFLYKYHPSKSWGEHGKDTLLQNKIFLSCKNNLNDPFECNYNCNKKTQENYLKEMYDKFMISCFTDSFDNILMWSHYAESHTGYCIKYDTIEIFKKFQSQLNFVEYEKEITTWANSKENYDKYLNLQKIYCTKSLNWSYENEWRLCMSLMEDLEKSDYYKHLGEVNFIRNSKNNDLIIGATVDFIKPKAIYLGCTPNEELKNDIFEICNKKDINLYQMNKGEEIYKLNSEEVYTTKNKNK